MKLRLSRRRLGPRGAQGLQSQRCGRHLSRSKLGQGLWQQGEQLKGQDPEKVISKAMEVTTDVPLAFWRDLRTDSKYFANREHSQVCFASLAARAVKCALDP